MADEDILGGAEQSGDLLTIESGGISHNGELQGVLADKLRAQWALILENGKRERTSVELDNESGPSSVPVVLLSKGLSSEHDHGSIVGDRPEMARFTMIVPAILSTDNVLKPDPDNSPWIRREFLTPTSSDNDSEEIPVVGTMTDFDGWLDRRPADVGDWVALRKWCESMWAFVTHGRSPEGFVEIEEERIYASKAARGKGQQVLKLYDVLLSAPNHPKLLVTVCDGRHPVEVGRDDRLRQIDVARGSMGATYGLAESQTDAVVAMTRLKKRRCFGR